MKLKYTFLIILVLIFDFKCKGAENTSTIVETTTVSFTETNSTNTTEESWGTKGYYGGSYFNSKNNPRNIHYIHGTYQHPKEDYYNFYDYYRSEDADALDYYFGFGLSKMTDKDFTYEDYHSYYHTLNRSITDYDRISSDNIISCHPNATFFCPENTETVCMMNGTIYCMSKIDTVVPCSLDNDNDTKSCINTTVPCVKDCSMDNNYFEEISLPCLATIIVVDVYENNKGTTLNRVGGTFVLVPALRLKDRTFCVSVIVDPLPPPPPPPPRPTVPPPQII